MFFRVLSDFLADLLRFHRVTIPTFALSFKILPRMSAWGESKGTRHQWSGWSLHRVPAFPNKSPCIVNVIQAWLCWLQLNKVEILCNDFTVSRQWDRKNSFLGFMLGITLEGTSIESKQGRKLWGIERLTICLSPMNLYLIKSKWQTTKFLMIYCFIGL